MSSITIRPASIKDVPSIIRIRLNALSEKELVDFSVPNSNDLWTIKKLKEEWLMKNKKKDGSEVFVAEIEKKIVGFIVYNMEVKDDNIDNIVVSKKMQRNGIGKALVEYVERLAKSRGFNLITTDTTENKNKIPWKAYNFWKKMGYKDTEKRLSTRYDFKIIPLVKKLK